MFYFCCMLFKAAAMRRQDSPLVSRSKENVLVRNADEIANVLDPAAVSSDNFDDFGAFGYNLPENMTNEPKLDAILADVASKLPSIDFDLSDVSFVDQSFVHSDFANLMKSLALICDDIVMKFVFFMC